MDFLVTYEFETLYKPLACNFTADFFSKYLNTKDALAEPEDDKEL